MAQGPACQALGPTSAHGSGGTEVLRVTPRPQHRLLLAAHDGEACACVCETRCPLEVSMVGRGVQRDGVKSSGLCSTTTDPK